MTKNLNKYGTDLIEVKNTLESSKVSTYIIDRAKKNGYLEARCKTLEKINNKFLNIEGHLSEDIYIKIWMNPFEKNFLPDYFLKIKEWVKSSYIHAKSKNSLKTAKNFFKWMWKFRSDIYPYYEHWLFRVDSFSAIKTAIAEEIMIEKLGGPENQLQLILVDYPMFLTIYEYIISDIDNNYVEDFLNTNYSRINSYMWISKKDPTCFVIDERLKKFDMKSGWSDREMLFHIERWFYWVIGQRIKIKNTKER